MHKPDLSFLTEEQRKRLSRDYEKEPLKRGEKVPKEDLEYLYMDLDLSDYELMRLFGKSRYYIQRCRYFHGMYKTKAQVHNKIAKTNLEKYGCACVMGNKDVRAKAVKTNLERYGVENVMHNREIHERVKSTIKERYGVEYPWQNKELLEKSQQTCFNHYGVTNPSKSELIKEKRKNTCIKKYGVENFTKSELYDGTAVAYRAYETKKKNCTLNTSKPEEDIYVLLIEKFGKDAVDRQYKSEEYPFKCDFYVKSMDLYIEYQGYWKHENSPFDFYNEEHQDKVKYWETKAKNSKKEKTKQNFLSAIYIWTVRDPLKRETARKNNSNWIEFFNMKHFMEWYDSL